MPNKRQGFVPTTTRQRKAAFLLPNTDNNVIILQPEESWVGEDVMTTITAPREGQLETWIIVVIICSAAVVISVLVAVIIRVKLVEKRKLSETTDDLKPGKADGTIFEIFSTDMTFNQKDNPKKEQADNFERSFLAETALTHYAKIEDSRSSYLLIVLD